MEDHSSEKHPVALVYCLSIDLIGSTRAGLRLTTSRLDQFNVALVNQIKPYLEGLRLVDALLKFAGDGWLLMTHKAEQVPALCCLATIMAKKFRDEMSQNTGIAIDSIPSLRLAICSGRDVSVELPDGRKDWVGDSARRATRSSQGCLPNTILIDEPIRYYILRDFDIKPVDTNQNPPQYQPTKTEERLTLYVLGELKPEVAADSMSPAYYVYTLGKIGRIEEAKVTGQQVAARLREEAIKLDITDKEKLRNWNYLMASLPDYSSALETFNSIRTLGLSPNVITYNTLINKAPDYDTAKARVDTMRAEGIQPDVITYNTLINKAPDYDTAKAWVDTMRAEGIQPNVITYSTLFSKDLSGKSADGILGWFLSQAYHPEQAVQAAIATYRKTGRIDEALRLALDYPHLQAARKLIRDHENEALSYFRTISDHDSQHLNADYALGVALMELGREQEGQPYLEKALRLARSAPRKAVIREWLRQIAQKLSQK